MPPLTLFNEHSTYFAILESIPARVGGFVNNQGVVLVDLSDKPRALLVLSALDYRPSQTSRIISPIPVHPPSFRFITPRIQTERHYRPVDNRGAHVCPDRGAGVVFTQREICRKAK